MKIRIYITVLIALFASNTNAQGFRILLKTDNFPVDSLFLSAYNYNTKKFSPIYREKYAGELTFADSVFLKPGLYLINTKNAQTVVEFLISDNNNQQFSVEVKNNDIIFEGSAENTANIQYAKSIRQYNQQESELDKRLQQIREGFESKQSPPVKRSSEDISKMQAKIDSLILEVNVINKNKLSFQQQTIDANKGTLLATIIGAVMEVPAPPLEYHQDGRRYYAYLAEHCFDKYDFSDDRIFATPLAYNKFRSFNEVVSELDAEDAIPHVLNALRKSQVSPQQYSELFDYIENDLGSIKSPFRKEALYIAMLKYAIDSTYIDPYRKERYLYELKIINKNHAGDKLPNFKLITNNGDSTNLYDIKSEYLLLYLQNPDCPTCLKTGVKMKEMSILNHAVSNKKLTVLTLYFEDEESLWRNYLKNKANPNWLHGWNYDLSIENDNLIDIRSIPVIYLLDKDKTILEKDINIYELELHLKEFGLE